MGSGRWFSGVLVGTLMGLTLAAGAHASTPDAVNSLASITPQDGQSLPASPDRVTLVFNQELERDDFISIDLTCDGDRQDTGFGERDDDEVVVTFAIRHELPRGPCIVNWRLQDGLGATIANGTTTFNVQADPSGTVPPEADTGTSATTAPASGDLVDVPVTAPPAQTAADEGSSGGALWLGRVLSTIGILVVFGALALISMGWPEGPEYIVTVRFLRTAWAVALAGTVLYVIAFAADATGSTFSGALSPTAWLDLMDAGWSGRGALLRLAAVVASGAFALRPERIIDPTSQMWAWAVPGVAVISVALGRVEGSGALLGFAVGAVHALGAAVWFGGVALVARVVLAGPGDEDLVQATRAFSRLSVPAILVTCVSGIVQMLRLDGGELFSSGHGRVVLLKVVAVAFMIAVGLAIRQQVGMRLDRAHEMSASNADRFRRAFGAEATLGVVVLAFSGWLLALSPPTADPLAGESYLPAIHFTEPTSGLDATLQIGPGKVGRNGFKLVVRAPESGISGLKLTFKPPASAPAEARFWIEQRIPELTGAGTAYLLSGGGVPLLAAGQWTVQLDATLATGPIAPQATFQVVGTDGTVVTEPAVQVTPNVSVTLVDPPTNTAAFATTTTVAFPGATGTSAPSGG